MNDERREYFRIDDEVTLEYQVITEAEMEGVLSRINDEVPDRFTTAASFASTSRQMRSLLHNLSTSSPDLSMCLQTLDKKLNLLAQLLVAESIDESGKGMRQVSLSAGGLAFNNDREIRIGDLLETRLVLFPSLTGVLTISRVVQCERSSEPLAGMCWRVAVEYQFIREPDRDLLVKHILDRQTEQLRARREEMKNG